MGQLNDNGMKNYGSFACFEVNRILHPQELEGDLDKEMEIERSIATNTRSYVRVVVWNPR